MSKSIFTSVTGSDDSDIRQAISSWEQRWGLDFSSVVLFPQSSLTPSAKAIEIALSDERVLVLSRERDEILREMHLLSTIANGGLEDGKTDTQIRYLSSLKRICGSFPNEAREYARDPECLCIGLNRAGYLLTRSLEWVAAERLVKLDAKRIPYRGGLLLGLGDLGAELIRVLWQSHTLEKPVAFALEGAIASGATFIALMNQLKQLGVWICRFYAVHAAWEGIASILQAADDLGINIRLTVGHADSGLNEKFYSVRYEKGREVLNLGDVGDNISAVLNY